MAAAYIPLSTSADLAVSSLQEAFRLAGDQAAYVVHVNPAQVTAAQTICAHFEPTIAVSVVSDVTLLPTEWYAFAPILAVAFGSIGP